MTSNVSRVSRQRLRVITIGTVLLLTLWIVFSPFGLGRHLQMQKRLAGIEQEIAELERRNLILVEVNERLQNDPDYLEEIARKKHGMVKQHETIYDFGRPGR
jgi:cell division protein FtsB